MTEDELSKIGIGIGLNVPVDRISWDEYFMGVCDAIAKRSMDSNTQFGCVFVRDNRILCTGYNSFPPGMPDDIMPNSRDPEGHKYWTVNHAEQAAIFFAARNGIALEGSTLYIQGHPCSVCCRILGTVGVLNWVIGNKTYVADELEILKRTFWVENFGVNIRQI